VQTVVADHPHESREREQRLTAELQRVYADALLAGEPRAAEAAIREAIEAGLPEATIAEHVIRPALVLVGDLWAAGRITIAEEHLATSISLRVLALQREAFRVARQRAARRVLLAGAEGERHVVGLEMAASVILHAGYDVRLLGADLPVDEIPSAVDRHRPAVFGFTTATVLTAVNLPAAFDAVRRISPGTGIVVGGGGVDEQLATTWDVVLCRHVADAVEQVDALVKRASRN
jgi:MerR family transcriptional regulator, light-induced transcriptional regulator